MAKHAAPHRNFTLFLLAFGAFFLLFGAVCAGSLYSIRQQNKETPSADALVLAETAASRFTDSDTRNILLITHDRGEAQGFAVLRTDPANIRTYLLAIPWETEIHTGESILRLREAYRTYSLPALTAALSSELHLPLHHYLALSYEALEQTISHLGNGLVFTLNETLTYQDTTGYRLQLAGGTQTLTASQVIAVLRYDAWHDGFRQRCAVQGEILTSLLNQYLITERSGKLEEDFAALIDLVSSDIRIAEFTSMKDGLAYLAERNRDKSLVTELTLNGAYETRDDRRCFVPLAFASQEWYAAFGKEAALP